MTNFKRKVEQALGSDRISSAAVTALVIALVVVFNALLYTLVQVFDLRVSYTDKLDYSLSGSTDELFKEAIEDGKKVSIYFCMAEEDVEVHSTGAEVYITAKNYAERYPDFIELNYINIITRQVKRANGEVSLINMSKYKTDMNGNETPIYKTSVIFECGSNYRVVTDTATSAGFSPFFNLDSDRYVTSYNGEEVMAAMISWVSAKEHKNAYFTQHHGEIADIEFTNLLACAGYYVNVIDLRKESVPEDADLLIISNPTSDFEAAREGSDIYTEIDRLRAYVERGGNLYVALDPVVKQLTVLEGFLSEYGIKFSVSEDRDGRTVRNIVKESRNAITDDGFTLVANYASSDIADKISARVSKYTDGDVILSNVSALELSGNAKPLLLSSGTSSLEADGKTVSDTGKYVIAACTEYTSDDGAEAKIFVVPSIYLAVSDSLIARGYSNKDFVYSLFEDFFEAEGMPYGCKPVMYSASILENLTLGTKRVYTAIIMMIPLAIAVTGAVIIVRRKNR